MSEHVMASPLDPLSGRFRVDELPRIAPWVYEEITEIGSMAVRTQIAELGYSQDEPLAMATWVKVIGRCHSELWHNFGEP
jgi:hypothetical protein